MHPSVRGSRSIYTFAFHRKTGAKNAVAWTQRCSELMPGKESRFSGLIKKLEQKVGD